LVAKQKRERANNEKELKGVTGQAPCYGGRETTKGPYPAERVETIGIKGVP